MFLVDVFLENYFLCLIPGFSGFGLAWWSMLGKDLNFAYDQQENNSLTEGPIPFVSTLAISFLPGYCLIKQLVMKLFSNLSYYMDLREFFSFSL